MRTFHFSSDDQSTLISLVGQLDPATFQSPTARSIIYKCADALRESKKDNGRVALSWETENV
jgi:hypothetical protein